MVFQIKVIQKFKRVANTYAPCGRQLVNFILKSKI